MEHYKLTVGVDPTNKYGKARMDLIQAFKSYSELNQWNRNAWQKRFGEPLKWGWLRQY